MSKSDKIQLFEDKRVRTAWDEERQEWYFSVVDVIGVLTDQSTPRNASTYWAVLKKRLADEGADELLTNCKQLKMTAADGKKYNTDVAAAEQLLRIIQSIPSPKAEPFKAWLAKVGSERLDETVNPELSIDRAVQNYRRLGYSESWINQRLKSIEVRKALTDEWDRSGVEPGAEYAVLTDLMSKTWSGMTTGEYKKHKGLKREALRDHMTNTELILNMLAEVAATDISEVRNPTGFKESAEVAEDGAKAAKAARAQIEESTGKSVVSSLNAKNLNQKKLTTGKDNET
jgi:hypothetical protein